MRAFDELGHCGDGVYLSHDGYQYWLAVNNRENKVVALDPYTLDVLMQRIQVHMTEMDKIRAKIWDGD